MSFVKIGSKNYCTIRSGRYQGHVVLIERASDDSVVNLNFYSPDNGWKGHVLGIYGNHTEDEVFKFFFTEPSSLVETSGGLWFKNGNYRLVGGYIVQISGGETPSYKHFYCVNIFSTTV